MTTPIVITAAGKDLRFNPDLATYNKYINEVMPHDKVSPATNYLRRIVNKDDKAHLDEVLKKPSALMRLLGLVNEAFEGDLEIEVKNS